MIKCDYPFLVFVKVNIRRQIRVRSRQILWTLQKRAPSFYTNTRRRRRSSGVRLSASKTILSSSARSVSSFIYERGLIVFATQDCIVESHVLAFVLVDPGVAQAGVLVSFELINRIVH